MTGLLPAVSEAPPPGRFFLTGVWTPDIRLSAGNLMSPRTTTRTNHPAAIAAASAAAGAAAEADSAMAAEQAADRAAKASISKHASLSAGQAKELLNAVWAGRVAPFLRILADPNRFRIVLILKTKGELDVSSIVQHLGRVGQPTVSAHLKRLEKAGLLHSRKVGKQVMYKVDAEYLEWRFQQVLSKVRE